MLEYISKIRRKKHTFVAFFCFLQSISVTSSNLPCGVPLFVQPSIRREGAGQPSHNSTPTQLITLCGCVGQPSHSSTRSDDYSLAKDRKLGCQAFLFVAAEAKMSVPLLTLCNTVWMPRQTKENQQKNYNPDIVFLLHVSTTQSCHPGVEFFHRLPNFSFKNTTLCIFIAIHRFHRLRKQC